MEEEIIKIPNIRIEWSDWHRWSDLQKDGRKKGGVSIPNGKAGIYEAKKRNAKKRLTIGKASNLRHRIRDGLIKGKIPHPAGKKIRKKEKVSDMIIRWAVTDRKAATEEELHRRHKEKFGKLPKYTSFT